MADRRLVYAGLVAITAIWGAQFALGKLLVVGIPPLTLAFVRSALATVLFALLALGRPGGLRLRRADLGAFVLLGLVGNPVYHGAFFLGLGYAPASDGALLLPTMNPVFTVLAAWAAGREVPTRQQLVGMAISALGVAIVFQAASATFGLPTAASPNRLLGDLLFLLSSLSWGIFSVGGRPLMARYGAGRATAICALIGIGPMAALSTLAGDTSAILRIGPSEWLIILFMAIMGAFLAFVIFNVAVVRIGAGAAARFTNLVPVWALVVAVLLLGERPTPVELVGGAVIVAGVWVSTAPRRARPAPAVEEGAPSPAGGLG